MACLQIYRELLSLATFLRVHSNSEEVSYLSWQNTYPNLKTTCHVKLKFFLYTPRELTPCKISNICRCAFKLDNFLCKSSLMEANTIAYTIVLWIEDFFSHYQKNIGCCKVHRISRSFFTAWKVSVFRVFLVRIFANMENFYAMFFIDFFFRLNQCLSKSMSLPVWLLEENTSCSFSDRIDLFAREIKWGCILWIFVIKQKMKLWSNTRCYYHLPLTTGTS